MTQGTIVQHSTFPDVLGLVGHGAWYYNEPGSHGAANPDSERLQFPALDERIASLIESASDRAEADADASPSAALASLRREIQAVVSEGDGVADSPRAAYLAEEWRAIDRFAQSVDAPPALTSFLGVEAFVAHFNLVWLAIQ
jgi:hypothetical protein